jgi:hypothetical protein
VTIELPNNDIARAASKGVDRRTLLKAGAWAAPVLVLTTAAPAMAASIEPVPKAQLTVSSYALSNLNNGGTPGPLSWAGGQISWSSPGTGQPTTASVSYTVVLSGPGGLSVNLATSATNISKYVKPLASGDYTVTLTAIGSDGATSATSNTLAIPVTPVATASTPTVAPSGGNKHSVSFVLTGTPGAVVQVSAVYTNASADTAFPPSVTIPVDGSITVSGIANATGKTSGSVAITLTGNGSIVTPTSLSAVIPPKG